MSRGFTLAVPMAIFIVLSFVFVVESKNLEIVVYIGRGQDDVYLDAWIGINDVCTFIKSLYRDFGDFGCCVESSVVEPDVCYTSTNLLAEYVLRNVCGRNDLADKIKAFLNRYPTDFYDYYQILLLKPFTLPFTSVEHVQVDTVNSIRVVHVRRTNVVLEDYYNYANLLAYKAVYHTMYNERDRAIAELGRLNGLFDGYGFADAYHREHGKYEAYKIALAIIPHKALGYTNEVQKYADTLLRIKPFATLYTVENNSLVGVGDLNLETACLAALALYAEPSLKTEVTKAIPSATLDQVVLLVIAIATIVATALLLYVLISKHRESDNIGLHALQQA